MIGAATDPHVEAVVAAVPAAAVIDAESIGSCEFEYSPGTFRLTTDGTTHEFVDMWPGWIRRLAPMDWEVGTTIGTHGAVVKSSWLSLIASISRDPGGRWLTSLEDLYRAENKLLQYSIAKRLGIAVPATIITNSPDTLEQMGSPLIAKPLGPGHFRDEDGHWLTVFTEPYDPEDADDLAILGGPPFIIQERLEALSHLRVVTVLDRVWMFELPATGLPIDWRESADAHRSWRGLPPTGKVASQARQIGHALNVGYSSQDWIVTPAGDSYFVDLNPAGQWLFLPDPGAREITAAIVEWLT